MWTVTINFEIHFMSVLETTSVFAVFMAVVILLVKRGYRRLFQSLRDGRCTILERFWERKPIPEENEEKCMNEISSGRTPTALPAKLEEIKIDSKSQQDISEDYKRLWKNAMY